MHSNPLTNQMKKNHITNFFSAAVPSSIGTACDVENNSISSTSHSDESFFLNKPLNADILCSPDDRNLSCDEEENKKIGNVCE